MGSKYKIMYSKRIDQWLFDGSWMTNTILRGASHHGDHGSVVKPLLHICWHETFRKLRNGRWGKKHVWFAPMKNKSTCLLLYVVLGKELSTISKSGSLISPRKNKQIWTSACSKGATQSNQFSRWGTLFDILRDHQQTPRTLATAAHFRGAPPEADDVGMIQLRKPRGWTWGKLTSRKTGSVSNIWRFWRWNKRSRLKHDWKLC